MCIILWLCQSSEGHPRSQTCLWNPASLPAWHPEDLPELCRRRSLLRALPSHKQMRKCPSQTSGVQSEVPGVSSPGSGPHQVCSVSEMILSGKLEMVVRPAFSV